MCGLQWEQAGAAPPEMDTRTDLHRIRNYNTMQWVFKVRPAERLIHVEKALSLFLLPPDTQPEQASFELGSPQHLQSKSARFFDSLDGSMYLPVAVAWNLSVCARSVAEPVCFGIVLDHGRDYSRRLVSLPFFAFKVNQLTAWADLLGLPITRIFPGLSAEELEADVVGIWCELAIRDARAP